MLRIHLSQCSIQLNFVLENFWKTMNFFWYANQRFNPTSPYSSNFLPVMTSLQPVAPLSREITRCAHTAANLSRAAGGDVCQTSVWSLRPRKALWARQSCEIKSRLISHSVAEQTHTAPLSAAPTSECRSFTSCTDIGCNHDTCFNAPRSFLKWSVCEAGLKGNTNQEETALLPLNVARTCRPNNQLQNGVHRLYKVTAIFRQGPCIMKRLHNLHLPVTALKYVP